MTRNQTRIDELKEIKGIKFDKQIAKDMGLDAPFFSRKINGNISMLTLERLAEYFEVTVKEMIK